MTIRESKHLLEIQDDIRKEKARISGKESQAIRNILTRANEILFFLRNTDDGKKNELTIKEEAKRLQIKD
ncbi:MAG: hypothetical protein ACPL3E_00885, partial [Minisyncoccia bacterium]